MKTLTLNMKIEARKTNMFNKVTYVGRIKNYENGRYRFSFSTGIHRISKEDALEDAQQLLETL